MALGPPSPTWQWAAAVPAEQPQPSGPGPGNTSLPVQGPLTGAPRRRPRAPDTRSGQQKRKQWPSRKQEKTHFRPPPVGSRKSRSRSWPRAPRSQRAGCTLDEPRTETGRGGAGLTEALVGSRVLSLGDPDAHRIWLPLSSTEPGLTSMKCVLHPNCCGKVFKQEGILPQSDFVIYTEGFGGQEIWASITSSYLLVRKESVCRSGF